MVIWVVLAVSLLLAPGARASTQELEAEVLEGSGELLAPGAHPASFRYAIVHHATREGRPIMSEWLRSQDSLTVTFVTHDGAAHRGVLRRLRHCFGRGLLVFTDPVRLREKQVIRLMLDRAS